MNSKKTSLLDLPDQLLLDVMGRVVSTSYQSLFVMKSVCKKFYTIMEEEERFLFRKVCLYDFTFYKPTEFDATVIIQKCLHYKNPAALFREGMYHCFFRMDFAQGWDFLDELAADGFMPSKYAQAIVCLFSRTEHLREKGISMVGELRLNSTTFEFSLYRQYFRKVLGIHWVQTDVLHHYRDRHSRGKCCAIIGHPKYAPGSSWQSYHDVEILYTNPLCVPCTADLEMSYVSRII